MQMEFIHKARFQQGQGQTSAAFAEHIGAAQFPAQGPEQFGKIRAALRAGSQGQHAYTHLAQGLGRGRGRRGRGGQKNRLAGAFLEQMEVSVRFGQARSQQAGQGLRAGVAVLARGQPGIVRPEGAPAHQHGPAAQSQTRAQFLHFMAGCLAADPLGLAVACGDPSVQGGGHLQNDIGPVRALPDQKICHQIAAFRFADRAEHFHSGIAQAGRAARGLGIGVRQAHDHPADARVQDGLGAGRRLALVVAGFQRDHQGAAFGVHAPRRRVFQAIHLGVVLSRLMVPAARHNPAVAQQHRPHRGVGAGLPAALFGQGYGLAHERSEILFSHGVFLRSCPRAYR